MRLRLLLLMTCLRMLNLAHAQESLHGHAGMDQQNNSYQGDVSHYPSQYDQPLNFVAPRASGTTRTPRSTVTKTPPTPKEGTLMKNLKLRRAMSQPVPSEDIGLENYGRCAVKGHPKGVSYPCFRVREGGVAEQMGLANGDRLIAIEDPALQKTWNYEAACRAHQLPGILKCMNSGKDRPMVLHLQSVDGRPKQVAVRWGFEWKGIVQPSAAQRPTQTTRPLPPSGFRSYLRR